MDELTQKLITSLGLSARTSGRLLLTDVEVTALVNAALLAGKEAAVKRALTACRDVNYLGHVPSDNDQWRGGWFAALDAVQAEFDSFGDRK